MPQRVVRTALIVVDAPGFDLGLRIRDRCELMHVQTLVAQASVERFNEGVFHRFPWADEVELDATQEGPVLKGARHEFRAVIDRDRSQAVGGWQYAIEGAP